jgi:hypothetical protein
MLGLGFFWAGDASRQHKGNRLPRQPVLIQLWTMGGGLPRSEAFAADEVRDFRETDAPHGCEARLPCPVFRVRQSPGIASGIARA